MLVPSETSMLDTMIHFGLLWEAKFVSKELRSKLRLNLCLLPGETHGNNEL